MSDVDFKIGANGDEAKAEFGGVAGAAEKAGKRIADSMREASYNMASSTKAATEQMHGHFAKVTESFGKVNSVLAGFAAVMAGGAVFKAGIDESVKLSMEATKLGKQLGITATQAGVLNVALGDVYADSETMLSANQKLTKTLGTNEQAFKNLGVATRDQNGNFRNSLDIMLDVNGKLMQFKDGVDRNIEGQKIYGKQWADVQGIVKLTAERMEDARKKSEELGLVVGKENVEAMTNYRASMNDVGDVLSAMKKSIGDALLPILTDFGNWFSSVGPEAVLVMKGTIGALASAFYGLKMVVEIAWEVIRLFVRTSVNLLLSYADSVAKALTFDFAAARAAWKNGANAIADDFGESLDRIVAKAEGNRDRMYNLFAQPTATTEKGGGTATSEGASDKTGNVSLTAEWKAELEARKQADGEFFKDSLAKDEVFWQSKLAQTKAGSKERAAVEHELFAIHKQMAVQKFNNEQEALKTEMAAARQGSAERVALAAESARRIGEAYGLESKEYLAAQREIKKANDEHDKELQKLELMRIERTRDHNLALIGMERDRLGLQKSLGQISSLEEVAALKKLKEREYQLEVQTQQDKIALMKEEGVAKQQQLDELAKMKDKHDADMAEIEKRRILVIKNNWDSVLSTISSAFEQSINGMIQGTQTWQQTMNNIGQNIAAETLKRGIKWVKDELVNILTVKTAHLTAENLKKDASDKGTTGAIANSAASATVSVTNAAVTTGANVGAKQAESDGWWAIAEGFAAMGIVMGMLGSIKSSAGGEWRVPTDRLNLVHKDETILPAHIAGPLRDMVTNGGAAGGGDLVFNGKGGDYVHKSDLVKLARQLKRNFVEV